MPISVPCDGTDTSSKTFMSHCIRKCNTKQLYNDNPEDEIRSSQVFANNQTFSWSCVPLFEFDLLPWLGLQIGPESGRQAQ